MKKCLSNQLWIPLWIDKWIFGSTRIECTLEERAIWIDFIALAGKDDGYIRANENTPYLLEQIAGLLIIPIENLKTAIQKFKDMGKINEDENGIIKILNWEKFQIPDTYKRTMKYRVKKGLHPTKRLPVTPNVTSVTPNVNQIRPNQTRSNQIKEKKRIKEKKKTSSFFNDGSLFPSPLYTNLHLKGKNLLKKKPPLKEKILPLEEGFNKFWAIYPWKVAKAPALKAWAKLCPDSSLLEIILSAVEAHKKTKQWQDKQFIPRPLTWLNQKRWEDEKENTSLTLKMPVKLVTGSLYL